MASFGGLIGSLFPCLSDRYGRKKILKILCLIGGISLILLALSLNYTILCVAGFLIGATTTGMICISVILCVETIDFKKRSQYIGYLFTTVLASNELSHFFISSLELWRNFMLCCAFLMILNFFAMSYIEESPRFLLTNQANIKASTKVIEKISLWNGEVDFKYSLVSENIKKQKSIWKDLWNSKIMKVQLIVCTLAWSSLYFGSSSIANISYTSTSNIWVYCSIHILGILPVLILMICINGIGRKKIIAWILVITGLIFIILHCYYASRSDEEFSKDIVVSILLLGLNFIMRAEKYLLCLYTAEMFPTQMRGSAFSFCILFSYFIVCFWLSRFNSIFPYPLAISGGFMILAAPVMVKLQETLGKEIDEMIEITLTLPLLPPKPID